MQTTIRVLGGLLSAYHLTEDSLYLERAKDLADRLLPSFDTKAGLPLPMTNLAQRKGIPDQWSPQLVSTAEISTLQLEMKYLSQLTEDEVYWERAEHVRMACVYRIIFLSLDANGTGYEGHKRRALAQWPCCHFHGVSPRTALYRCDD